MTDPRIPTDKAERLIARIVEAEQEAVAADFTTRSVAILRDELQDWAPELISLAREALAYRKALASLTAITAPAKETSHVE